jgi:predicted Fe-Mo cluster-binding NifX family protein
MKIAVTCEGKNVADRFEYCANFIIYYIFDGSIEREVTIPNIPGLSLASLVERGVQVIINGGIDGDVVNAFNAKNITVISGASGDARKSVVKYLAATQV